MSDGLIDARVRFDHSMVDVNINQWHRMGSCVHVSGHTLGINSDNLEMNCYTYL